MDGFLVLNKEKNMTSHDACFKVKRILKIDKCGHTGTLDPNTTGVLVIGINNATKLMPLLNEHDKEYKTTIIFGLSTDTLDITGKVIEEVEIKELDINKIYIVLNELKKQTKQIPPMYSSIKIDGKKLYEYARKGQVIDVPARDINVYDIKAISDLYKIDNKFCIDIYLSVGKGYYVRSFVKDLSDKLGVVATMKELERISCEQFNIKNSFTLDNLRNNEYTLLSIEEVFSDLEKLVVNDYLAKLVSNGVVLDERQIITEKPFLVYNREKLIAVYDVASTNKYKPLLIIK